MYRCGEDCDRTFSSSRGLNQHRSSCPTYQASHARVLTRVSTTLCVPEKCSRSGSKVSLHWQSLCYPSSISSALQVGNPARPSLHPHLDQDLSAKPITVSVSQVCGISPISWAFLNTKDRRLLGTRAHVAHAPRAKPLMWGSLSYVVLPLDHQWNANINQFLGLTSSGLNLVGYQRDSGTSYLSPLYRPMLLQPQRQRFAAYSFTSSILFGLD